MSKNKYKYKLKKGFAIDQNSGGKKGFVRGKRKETSLNKFDNYRDLYWTKVADEFLEPCSDNSSLDKIFNI